MALACVHKGFTLTGCLKLTSTNDFVAARNTRLKQLLLSKK